MKTTKASVNKQLAELNKLFSDSKYSWKLQKALGVFTSGPAVRLMLQVDKEDHQSMDIWEVTADNSYLDDINVVVGSMIMGIEYYKLK